MKTFTVFPNLKFKDNPYIQDFIDALNKQEGIRVINPAHKNPLLSILFPRHWGNVFIFNWFESIPDFKYGLLQSLISIFFLITIKLSGRKIIWILHNKQPHAPKYGTIKQLLAKLIAKHANLIITHATDGIKVISEKYPYAIDKTHFFHHPTKNRLNYLKNHSSNKTYDVLIWGAIAKYKGIIEFIDYLNKHPEEKIKVCIIGKCSSTKLYNNLIQIIPPNVTLIHERASLKKIAEYSNLSHFTLMPYFSRSILSSGILMDSLSLGAKIIGPHTGAFKDYLSNPLIKVYTFESFKDIYSIINKEKSTPISLKNYQKFLEDNCWESFVRSLIQLL